MSSQTQTYQRFPIARRIEHIVMILSFSLLGLTGLPQKFPTLGISIFIARFFGSVENLRLVHHIAATVMMLGIVWHILVAAYKIFVTKEPMSMLPVIKDAVDGIQVFLYNIGIGKKYPQMGRYNFEEKLEYWAFVWGAIVMGLTGFMMWNPLMTLKILPGEATTRGPRLLTGAKPFWLLLPSSFGTCTASILRNSTRVCSPEK